MANQKLTPEVLTVLFRSTITGNVLVLPAQLERSLYESVNKALVMAGGKWKRGHGHVFTTDPREKLGLAVATGVVVDEKKKYQAFYTPPELALLVVQRAMVRGYHVLEPSAGHGALADACKAAGADEVTCVELQPESAAILREKGYATYNEDFLGMEPRIHVAPVGRPFTRVVMNPPFTKGQDAKHVLAALKWLTTGGRLVSIVPGRARDIVHKWELSLKGWSYELEDLPAGSFKSSGTQVNTSLLTIQL